MKYLIQLRIKSWWGGGRIKKIKDFIDLKFFGMITFLAMK